MPSFTMQSKKIKSHAERNLRFFICKVLKQCWSIFCDNWSSLRLILKHKQVHTASDGFRITPRLEKTFFTAAVVEPTTLKPHREGFLCERRSKWRLLEADLYLGLWLHQTFGAEACFCLPPLWSLMFSFVDGDSQQAGSRNNDLLNTFLSAWRMR